MRFCFTEIKDAKTIKKHPIPIDGVFSLGNPRRFLMPVYQLMARVPVYLSRPRFVAVGK